MKTTHELKRLKAPAKINKSLQNTSKIYKHKFVNIFVILNIIFIFVPNKQIIKTLMKIAITSENDSAKSNLDLRFGRAAWFCIYDTETKKTEFIVNENINANGGAGTKTAEKMAEMGVQQVISGDFGPKAKDLLDKFKIQMVILEDRNKKIGELIKQINSKSTVTT